MKVTTISEYDDNVWDYWHEYHACTKRCENRIHWSGVWERNPAMRVAAKAYCWRLKQGTAMRRPYSWRGVSATLVSLRRFAELAEAEGHTNFGTVTNAVLHSLASKLPQNRAGWGVLNDVGHFFAAGRLPHMPEKSPFAGHPASEFIAPDKVNQTKPISNEMMGRIVKRCRKYEKRFPRLQKLKETQDWKCSFARSIGVRGKNDLNREWRLTQTAGLIMLLAATGMRASEIMGVERDGLACVTGGATTLWYVNGTVFKFHYGEKTRWLCGSLGRRAHALLSKLTSERKLASNSKGGQIGGNQLNLNLKEWMAAQEWRDADGNPLLVHSHQFRRTFARLVMRHPGMNLLALKDHFKHKSVKMTDYYVGCDDELRAMILDGHPGAQMDAFDAEMRMAAGLEDAS